MKKRVNKKDNTVSRPVLNPDLTIEETPQGFEITWRDMQSSEKKKKVATSEELLAIKLIADDISPLEAATRERIPQRTLSYILANAARKDILRLPAKLLIRDEEIFNPDGQTPADLLSTDTFTLQWHITNACDLSCKHCYDRSKRSPLTLSQGMQILDQLNEFSRARYVKGHVCFTGGNPFLSPHFIDLYREAVKKGFSTSILGNPVDGADLSRLCALRKPEYFQVSLEGLKEHTDYMRGSGYFDRVCDFLGRLAHYEVSSAVMLTLTSENIDQVIPLAQFLRGKTDHFTFNRLSLVGEGAHLRLPDKNKYKEFLAEYIETFKEDDYIGYKDNLINALLTEKQMKTFNGCTGFGCGAAFNFVALLPDGEVHACRKFPSSIGNILERPLSDMYDSLSAQQYRQGSQNCRGCRLRSICGGCLAVTYSHEHDVFIDSDPFCFISD